MRLVLRGGEGRDDSDEEVPEADKHRRSRGPAHELLQKLQVLESAVEPHRPPHLRHASASPSKLGFSQSFEVDAE